MAQQTTPIQNQAIFMARQTSQITHESLDTGDPSDIRNWGVDSGATRHFTHTKSDLINATPCDIAVTIADGSVVRGTIFEPSALSMLFNDCGPIYSMDNA